MSTDKRNKLLSAAFTAALVATAALATDKLVAQSRTVNITQADRTSIENAIHKVAARDGLHAVVSISDRIVDVRDTAARPASNREVSAHRAIETKRTR